MSSRRVRSTLLFASARLLWRSRGWFIFFGFGLNRIPSKLDFRKNGRDAKYHSDAESGKATHARIYTKQRLRVDFGKPRCARFRLGHDRRARSRLRGHAQGNPAIQDIAPSFQRTSVQIKHILLGADQAHRAPQLARFVFDGYGILLRVAVMVAKELLSHDRKPQSRKIRQKSGRIANAAKGKKLLPPSFGERYFARIRLVTTAWNRIKLRRA